MSRLQYLLFAIGVGAFGVGCGGTSTGLIPASSPLVQFQAPEKADLLPDTATTPEDDEADDWSDEDLLGEDGAEEAADMKAPDASAPAAKPAPK